MNGSHEMMDTPGLDKGGDDFIEQTNRAERNTNTFDSKLVARIRWKCDFALIPLLWLLYTWSFIDRINIGNARLYGLEKELGMVGYNFNTALTIYYVAYVAFELPANILCKVIGPGWFLPGCTILFGIISLATAYVNSYTGLLVVRFFLGIVESGIFPGCIYFLTRWYTKAELVFRAGLFLSGASFAGMFAGVLSYAIVNDISEIAGVKGWRMLFFVEGIVTIGVGIVTIASLSDSPEKAWFLTAEERIVAVQRIKAQDPAQAGSGSDAANKTRKQAVYQGIFNINVWLIGACALCNSIVLQGLAVFLPTIITGLYGSDPAVIRNLRSAPPWAVGFVWTVLIPFLSWKSGGYRGYWGLGTCLPLIIVGFALFLGGNTPGTRYAGAFLIAPGSACLGGLLQAWGSANLAPDASRAAGIGIVTFCLNIGGLISTWVYLPGDAPLYKTGHSVNIAMSILQVILHVATLAYMKWENRQRAAGKRDNRLKGLDETQEAMLGHKHPEYRYSY